MKAKTNRRAIVAFILGIALCLTMMTSGTIAWFTDEVTSSLNTIQAGNLDVELYYQRQDQAAADTWTEVTDKTDDLFLKDARWEPGHTELVKLKVVNAGNLALQYQLSANIGSETPSTNVLGSEFKLSDSIKYGIIADNKTYTRDEAVAAVDGTAAPLNATYQSAATELEVGGDDVVTMVVYMPATVGNEANHAKDAAAPVINLGVKLVATQVGVESDSFGKDYDDEATFPGNENVLKDGDVTVTLPAGAKGGVYKLNVIKKDETTDAAGKTSLEYDITLTVDGEKITAKDNVNYKVNINVGKDLIITGLTHNGTPITVYDYNADSGVLIFTTSSFGPFVVEYITYDDAGDNIVIEDGKVTGGLFTGIDPVELDPTLAEDNSEYIVATFTANNKTYHSVSEKATTVFVTPDQTLSGDYNGCTVVTSASGKLWSIIDGLKNNAHSTVYLLPGTYNEGTTINVYSSMDIIGLGDKDAVKVIKQSSSDSNRHLFNCNGTKAKHIEVTLRNLYLDATVKTNGGKDNAAVQSIRKTKVKCYDLTIVKGTDWDAVAFYVNGNNAVDGVKYTAYLYAENCTLNTTRTFGIVTTNGSYKFYHNNLTYNNGTSTYTKNSGSILNKQMEANDWEW